MAAQVTINGAVTAFDESATLGDVVLRALTKPDGTLSDQTVAVAVNQLVVPRSDWPTTALQSGDKIEIIPAGQER